MITKEYITEIKNSNSSERSKLISNQQNPSTLYSILNNLGILPSSFDGDCWPQRLRSDKY